MEEPKEAEYILPELVWKLVLDNLTMKDDILSFGQACQLFRRLYYSYPRREIVLFDKAFPHLVKYLVDDKTRENILKLRSICNSWKDGVDNLHNNLFLNPSSYRTRYKWDWDTFRTISGVGSKYTFGNHFQFGTGRGNLNYNDFLTEMRSLPGNPFIGHSISLNLEYSASTYFYDNENSPSVDDLNNFLDAFGKHIWTLQLRCNQSSRITHFDGIRLDGNAELPVILHRVFSMPNLKKLILKSDVLLNPKWIDLYNRITTPHKLEMADLISVRCDQIFQIICLKLRFRLKVLHIRKLREASEYEWCNLKELHLKMNVEPEWPNTDLDLLGKIKAPKLELLALGIRSRRITLIINEAAEKITRTKIFYSILKSLENLVISSPNLKTIRFYSTWLWEKSLYLADFLDLNLQCPENIKTLEFQCDPGCDLFCGTQLDFSFLKHFSYLENIHIKTTIFRQTVNLSEVEESVQVYKFLFPGEMYKSNIWQVMPNLQTFTYLNRTYKRSCFERLRVRMGIGTGAYE